MLILMIDDFRFEFGYIPSYVYIKKYNFDYLKKLKLIISYKFKLN